MMTEQLEVSILAAPLAAIDRRALSQAWYTALQHAPRSRTTPATVRAPVGAPALLRARDGVAVTSGGRAPSRLVRLLNGKSARGTFGGDGIGTHVRCRLRSQLAQRIERAFSDSRGGLRRATFSLGRGNVRVHVILQTKGEKTVLLALCPPEVRTIVARALTEVRFALAARGIGLEVQAREVRRCS
ncbi:MAG: hypothetical protein WA431_10490 [Candidatus Cybelea sp.]